jgi:hypothetical protein
MTHSILPVLLETALEIPRFHAGYFPRHCGPLDWGGWFRTSLASSGLSSNPTTRLVHPDLAFYLGPAPGTTTLPRLPVVPPGFTFRFLLNRKGRILNARFESARAKAAGDRLQPGVLSVSPHSHGNIRVLGASTLTAVYSPAGNQSGDRLQPRRELRREVGRGLLQQQPRCQSRGPSGWSWRRGHSYRSLVPTETHGRPGGAAGPLASPTHTEWQPRGQRRGFVHSFPPTPT